MTLVALKAAAEPQGLMVMGHTETHVLLGTDRSWWQIFEQSAEFGDGLKDPVDRWSKRVIGSIARVFGARDVYPSDGPPYAPFIAWAEETGRFWQSPTGMLVHDIAGLMISIRGALVFSEPIAEPERGENPCNSCEEQPCISACPVGALSADAAYNVAECKAFLKTTDGRACMDTGCEVRRACPVSQRFARPEVQSAFHMRAFLG